MIECRQGVRELTDEIRARVRRNGGCEDWPCDYACLRRSGCDHENRVVDRNEVNETKEAES